MRPQFVANLRRGPGLVNDPLGPEAPRLREDLVLALRRRQITCDEQDEALDVFLRPTVPVLEEFVGRGSDLSRRERVIALALPHLDTVALTAMSEQVDAVLALATDAIKVARRDAWFGVEEVAAEFLEDVLVELVEWRGLAEANAGIHSVVVPLPRRCG